MAPRWTASVQAATRKTASTVLAVAVGQQGPVRTAHGLLHQRLQQPIGAGLLAQQLADQSDAEPGAGGIQQQARVGEVQPLSLLADRDTGLHRPMIPVHFPLAMQGGALGRGYGQQAWVTCRVEAVGMQHPEAALGLGADVVTQGDIDGLGGHVRYFIGAVDPQIHLWMSLAKIPQAWQ